MRLLAYTDSAQVGGAELALGYLIAELAPSYEVVVIACEQAVAEEIAAARPGTAAISVPRPRGFFDRGALLEHLRTLRGLRPAVMHANQAWPGACAHGELAGLLTPGVAVLAVDHLPRASAVPRVQAFARRALARRVGVHVAVGVRAARQIEALSGLPAGSVLAVPNGVPPLELTPVPAPAPPPIVGSVGRLTEQKGYDLLVRALPDLPGATLVLVGDGPQRGELEGLAAELQVGDRLVITGWRRDARSYLSSFDVFALPSRWEGMPLGILEAMQAGLPVLAADVGSVTEAVEDRETGLVVAPDDLQAVSAGLATLLGDEALRRRMGSRAREVALGRFTAAAMARRYEAIYEDLVRPGRPGSSRSAR
jgi:glycosyltransferase involved in cell wall biosynthesis